jgi:hypothetical protein
LRVLEMASTVQLHVHDHFNPEEAAHAAAEFVSSGFSLFASRTSFLLFLCVHWREHRLILALDNLPAEVSFLLEEIREKDQEINSELNTV